MSVVNSNKNNYLQYGNYLFNNLDCSIIKDITISNNGTVLERITDYHILTNILNDVILFVYFRCIMILIILKIILRIILIRDLLLVNCVLVIN